MASLLVRASHSRSPAVAFRVSASLSRSRVAWWFALTLSRRCRELLKHVGRGGTERSGAAQQRRRPQQQQRAVSSADRRRHARTTPTRDDTATCVALTTTRPQRGAPAHRARGSPTSREKMAGQRLFRAKTNTERERTQGHGPGKQLKRAQEMDISHINHLRPQCIPSSEPCWFTARESFDCDFEARKLAPHELPRVPPHRRPLVPVRRSPWCSSRSAARR